jgi:hypothetical protein
MTGTGSGLLTGVLADWNPLDSPWSERVQEAVAEVLKDALLPDVLRVYDNRTNWTLDKSKYQLLLTKMGAVAPTSFTRFSGSPFPPIADITFEGVTYAEINTTIRRVVPGPPDPTDIPQQWDGIPPYPEPFTAIEFGA